MKEKNVKNRLVTIVDIAEYLGMSKATVSCVLSGQAKKRRVAEKTAHRVKQVAKDLGYVPNHWARCLQGKSSRNISIFFSSLQLNWAEQVAYGIKKVLGPNNYSSVIMTHDYMNLLDNEIILNGQRELDAIIKRRDEGVICQPNIAVCDRFTQLSKSGIPIVFIGSLPEDMAGCENASSVTWNCAEAVETAVAHLIQSGRQRIGFIGVRHGVKSDETRFLAYRETMEKAGLPVKDQWIAWEYPGHLLFEKMDLIFSASGEKPDSFFVINDAVAIAMMEKLGLMGIRIPDDVSLVGMGDLPITNLYTVNLTTVREPLEEIGCGAGEVILELIRNPGQTPIHRKISCNELKIRRSTKLA